MENLSTRDRISQAVSILLSSNQPINRRSIASLAKCNLRTVSNHKDLWKDFVQIDSTPRDLNAHGNELLLASLTKILHQLETRDFAEELGSMQAASRWFRQMSALYSSQAEFADVFARIETAIATVDPKKGAH